MWLAGREARADRAAEEVAEACHLCRFVGIHTLPDTVPSVVGIRGQSAGIPVNHNYSEYRDRAHGLPLHLHEIIFHPLPYPKIKKEEEGVPCRVQQA